MSSHYRHTADVYDRHTGLYKVKSCFSKQEANRHLGMDLCDPSCSLACCFRKGKWVGVRFQQRTGTSGLASPGKRWDQHRSAGETMGRLYGGSL